MIIRQLYNGGLGANLNVEYNKTCPERKYRRAERLRSNNQIK